MANVFQTKIKQLSFFKTLSAALEYSALHHDAKPYHNFHSYFLLPSILPFFHSFLLSFLLVWRFYRLVHKGFMTTSTLTELYRVVLGRVGCQFGYRLLFQNSPSGHFTRSAPTTQSSTIRFVTSYFCFEIGSMSRILEKLKWESLKKIMRDSRLILLYKGWNALPDSIITSAEGAEDGVARFTSLVRARD